jgi:RNA polymerase sigma-70 factor, ECF subfamily
MSIAAPIEPTTAAAADATRVLFERHSARIHAFCLRRLGTREEADDAVQQTYLKAFASVRGGVVPAFEKAWLYRIAENVCTDRLRSATRRRLHETEPEALAVVAAPPRVPELDGIGDALAELTEQQRRVLLLREWQGLSYREIGRELSLSQSAVETLLFRARRSLARRLEAFSLAGWVKSTLVSGGATKAAAAAVATIGVGALAIPPAVERLDSARAQHTAPRENVKTQPRAGAIQPAPAQPRVRSSEPQAARAGSGNARLAESLRSDAESSVAVPSAGASAAATSSESRTPAPPSSVAEPSGLDGPTATVPSVPSPPELPVSVVPELTVPSPVEVVEPVVEVLEPVVEAVPSVPETAPLDLPALP